MRALIVEDDLPVAQEISIILERMGFETRIEPDVESATSATLAEPFDLFVIDYLLGAETSVGLSHWLRVRSPEVPILLVTGQDVFSRGEYVWEMPGVDLMLRKPFREKDFRAVVEHLTSAPATASRNRTSAVFPSS